MLIVIFILKSNGTLQKKIYYKDIVLRLNFEAFLHNKLDLAQYVPVVLGPDKLIRTSPGGSDPSGGMRRKLV